MKYFIIVGEASGDLHGANLVKEIKELDPNANFVGWGGDLMQACGVSINKHYRELAFMGFWEVIKNLRTIKKNLQQCKNEIVQFNPDVVICIDYPGFNMRIAEFTHQKGYKNIYYISPQVWAWKANRVKKIKRIVAKMLVILPFEKKWYAENHNFEVTFVGHPLIDAIEQFRSANALSYEQFKGKYQLNDKPIIALLPGSRKQEIKIKLPIMLSVIDDFPDYQFIIAGAPSQDESFYRTFIHTQQVAIVFNDTYNLLNNSRAALVTSGTATLETALFNVPQIVCYKGSSISYQIAKRVIKVKYISLVNLIADKEIVKELIQNELNSTNVTQELRQLLTSKREAQLQGYATIKQLCGGTGASKNAAKEVLSLLRQ
jgi:lipid-A-disaccharide synthase